jgi:hypothetical protein
LTAVAPRIRSVPKQRSTVYLRRGWNLLSIVEKAEEIRNWDGVATAGVQSAIAFSDAYTVAKLGLRSRGQDHMESVTLVSRVGTAASAALAAELQKVLSRKSEVEYGDREVSAADARRIAQLARRVGAIVSGELQ